MKKIFLFAALFCSLAASAQTADEAAVKSLIAREKAAWFASDWTAWSACWAHEPYISSSGNAGTVYQEIGWKTMEEETRAAFEQDPLPWPAKTRRENWNFHFNGNMVLVTFNQIVTEDSTGYLLTSIETRTCEKIGSDWKIIHANSLVKSPNYYALSMLIRGLSYAEAKGETPETYADAIFAWRNKTTGTEPRTLPQFLAWMQEWHELYQLDAEVLKSSDALFQIRRTNFGKYPAAAGFFQYWGNRGADVERYYRQHWKLDAEAAGLTYEVTDDGDKTVVTVQKK